MNTKELYRVLNTTRQLLTERVLLPPSKRSAFGEDPLGAKERKRRSRSKDTLRHHYRGGSPLSIKEEDGEQREEEQWDASQGRGEIPGRFDKQKYPTADEIERKWTVPYQNPSGDDFGSESQQTVGRFPDGNTDGEMIDGQLIPSLQDQLQQGVETEMGKMTKPDRSIAMDTVISNLKQNPRFYMNLVAYGLEEKKQQKKDALKGILGALSERKRESVAYYTNRNLRECVEHKLI